MRNSLGVSFRFQRVINDDPPTVLARDIPFPFGCGSFGSF